MATNGLNLQTSGLTFATGTVDRMIIDSSGQFGFGTIAPSTDFHVDAAGVRFEGIPSSSSNSNFMVVDGNGVVGTRSDIAVGTVVTDVTEASNVVTVAYNDIADTTFTIDSLTSVAYDTSWGIAQSGTGTVSGNFELPFITAGTYNAGTITLAINGGLESDIEITGIDGTDTFVTSGAINSPASGTLRLTRNDGANIDVTGFQWSTTGDAGTSTMYNGDRLNILGGTGISTIDDGSLTIQINLDDTAVTAASYGDASTVATFTVNQQGQLTAAAEVAIDITASQVSDFNTEVLADVFTNGNFTDSSEVNFTVSAGASVTAALIDGSIANARLANDSITFNGTTGSNPDIALGQSLTFASSDGSVIINGAASVLDLSIDGSVVSQNIYTDDGTLAGARTVTQSGNLLRFTGGDFEIGGGDFHYDNTNDNVGIGTSTPVVSAKLEVSSTTQGFLFPRMIEDQRIAISNPATGLMVYQTDNDEGVYIFKSFGWVQVI